MSSSSQHAFSSDKGGDSSWIVTLLGVLCAAVGVALLFNLTAAVATIVLLVGLSLLISAVTLLMMDDTRSLSTWAGAGLIAIGGIAVLAWPHMTLWALAAIAGVSLMFCGAAETFTASSGLYEGNHRVWAFIGGIVTFGAGLLAIAWPAATVAVLAVLFGLRTFMFGITTVLIGREIRSEKTGRRLA
jgi:uncharacterized membrane protein HdeD (DUF308 family)